MSTLPNPTDRARNTRKLASSPLVTAAVLGALAVAVGLLLRPRLTGRFGGFGGDASTIQSIMSSPFSASDLGYGSYSVIADFYTRIGMAHSPAAAALLGALTGSVVLGCVFFRIHGVHDGRISVVLALITPLMIGIYQAAYTKEILISLGMLVIVLMPLNILGEALVIGTLCVLGVQYRTYWLIIAVLYVLLRLILVRGHSQSGRSTLKSLSQVVGVLLFMAVLTGLAVWLGAGVPADSFRTDANDTSVRQYDTGSLITRFIDAPEPLGGVLNSTLTTLFFIIPLPMLAKLSPYYLVIGTLFTLIWLSAVYAASVVRRTTGGEAPRTDWDATGTHDSRLLVRFTALPLAFLIVQGLFEPDWGSALRHTTPLLPLIVGAVTLAERRSPPPAPPTPYPSSRLRTIMTTRPSTRPDNPATHAGPTPRTVLIDYLGYLRTWWWMLIIGLVVGVLAGWGASALMTKDYIATAQVYVGTASTGGSSDAYQGALLSQKQVGSYAEIANSRALGQRIVDDLELDQTADEITSMIHASAHRDTVILDLQATSSDPNLSRDVANSAAAQLQAMVRELNDQTSPQGPSGAPQLALLNDAVTPDSPSSPKPLENIIIGGVLGMLLGILAAVVRGLTDRRLTTASGIRAIVDAPLIGTIGTTEALAHQHTLDFSAAPTPAAEQFRTLRTNLRFLDVDNAPTVLAVTSGMPCEGKSTLAVNLALSLADDGEAVCLVDADLRNPSIASYVDGNLQSAVGLSTALAGAAEIDDVIQATATDGLSVITSGPTPPNPAELLGSQRFVALLAHLATHFDHVILDTSPVLPVTDGALVSSSADGVILTICHSTTTTDQLTATRNNLAAVNSRVLGTVFTMAPETKGKGYHGYGYGSPVPAPIAPPATTTHLSPTRSTESTESTESTANSTGEGDSTDDLLPEQLCAPRGETTAGVEH